MANNKLASEKVILSAPMSFAGSTQRIWRITHVASAPLKALAVGTAILLLLIVWPLVLAWYCIFGLWLVPYRVLRRGNRKRNMENLRHQEHLGQLQTLHQQQQLQTSLLAMQQTNLMYQQQMALQANMANPPQQTQIGVGHVSPIPAPPQLAPPGAGLLAPVVRNDA